MPTLRAISSLHAAASLGARSGALFAFIKASLLSTG
jgi:hypothetical protein